MNKYLFLLVFLVGCHTVQENDPYRAMAREIIIDKDITIANSLTCLLLAVSCLLTGIVLYKNQKSKMKKNTEIQFLNEMLDTAKELIESQQAVIKDLRIERDYYKNHR